MKSHVNDTKCKNYKLTKVSLPSLPPFLLFSFLPSFLPFLSPYHFPTSLLTFFTSFFHLFICNFHSGLQYTVYIPAFVQVVLGKPELSSKPILFFTVVFYHALIPWHSPEVCLDGPFLDQILSSEKLHK